MNAINKLRAKIRELRNYVEENTRFNVEIKTSNYPVTISFYEDQVGMLSESVSDTAPSLCFIFDDEMRIVTAENIEISETTFNKLKNLSKEVNRLYLHSFREEVDKVIDPMWDVSDGISQVVIYRKRRFDSIMNVGE